MVAAQISLQDGFNVGDHFFGLFAAHALFACCSASFKSAALASRDAMDYRILWPRSRDFDQIVLLAATRQFRQRQNHSQILGRARIAAHRGAKTILAGMRAVDDDDQSLCPAGDIARIRKDALVMIVGAAIAENLVLNLDRAQLARADANERA